MNTRVLAVPPVASKTLVLQHVERVRAEMGRVEVSIALLANPTSLRYVAGFRDYELFQSRKELECMRYAIRVADEGMRQMRDALVQVSLVPGVTCARCHRKVAMTAQLMRNGDFM